MQRLQVRRPGFGFDWVSPALGDHDSIPAAQIPAIGHRNLGPKAKGWVQVASEAFQELGVRQVADRLPRWIRSSRELQANHGKQDREVANAQLRDETALDPADLCR